MSTPKIRLLLVDDQALFREGLRTLLTLVSDFLLVGEAADGREAVALAQNLRPDVILMDLRMPGMDGMTAIRHLRARNDAKAGLPVIVVTADAGATIDADCRAAGADDVMMKPVAMDVLFDTIGRAIAERGDQTLL